MKKILITGADSYIGTSFENYIKQFDLYQVDTIDMRTPQWKEKSFSDYDVVFHVAAIVHTERGNKSPENQELVYEINVKLAQETAVKAKAEGVKQFIFMSSASVYGVNTSIKTEKIITRDTPVSPSNIYGESKVKAEEAISNIADDKFKVVILRPPMVYGYGCKGKYQSLSKIAKKAFAFPYVKNERSMIYIGNLVEFIKLIIDNEEQGLFFPQNREYINTSAFVEKLRDVHGKKTLMFKGFRTFLRVLGNFSDSANTAFGTMKYDESISKYKEDYCKYSFDESVKLSEFPQKTPQNTKVLILVNHFISVYYFRWELLVRLVEDGYDVYLSCPKDERVQWLLDLGCKYFETDVERRSKNPFRDLKLIHNYKKIMREVKPDIVLTYTIKPNIYGGIAARSIKIPHLANVTGLGTAIEDGGLSGGFILRLYKYGMKKTKAVFFQNKSNLKFCKDKRVVSDNAVLLPGSGVNLEKHCFEEYPQESDKTIFLIIGRLMKNKGTDEIFEAARIIKRERDDVVFRFIGFYEDDYKQKTEDAVKEGIIEFCGNQKDVHSFVKESHATILASYHEGMSNVLLETAATGRPVIASDIPGCRETFEPYVSGIPFEPKNVDSLLIAIRNFLNTPYEERAQMGKAGRKWVEKQFDRQIVVNKYIETIRKEVK